MSRISRLLACSLLCGFMASSMLGCSNEAEPQKANAAEKSERVLPVSVATVGTGEFIRTVRATGTIRPYHDAGISAGVTGRVVKRHVQVGDYVQAGALLLEIDPEYYQAQYEQAKVANDKAQSDLARNEEMYKTKDISETLMEAARVQAKTALVSLKTAERHLRDARIRSPFNGWIASLPIALGSTVNPGEPLVSVVDIKKVKLEIGVSSEDVTHLRSGQTAKVHLDVYPNQTFSGKVTAVGPQAEASTRLFPVEIRIKNTSDIALRGGMVARAEIEYERLDDAILVPHDAVSERFGERIVFRIQDNVAQRIVPELGALQDGYYLVKSGIELNDAVVVAGQESLQEGTKVEIK